MEATWEAWRRAEGGLCAREPAVRIGIEFDRVIVDLRPVELAICMRLQKVIKQLMEFEEEEEPVCQITNRIII